MIMKKMKSNVPSNHDDDEGTKENTTEQEDNSENK